MRFRREEAPAVLSQEEIDALALGIAEAEPAYLVGRQLIEGLCRATGMDEGQAAAMLLEGGGMPSGLAAVSARAANDLVRLAAQGDLEGAPEGYLEDERFTRLLLEMPVKAALRLYAAECRMEENGRLEREKGARDVMEKLAARRALPAPIRADAPAAASTDYANMPAGEFHALKQRLMQAAAAGRRARL